MQRSALPAQADRRADSGATGPATPTGYSSTGVSSAGVSSTGGEGSGPVGGESAADIALDNESVVVHVQLRPRRGATRKCLTALAALAAEHDSVSFAVSGVSKDDRVVRVTVGVDLGPRAGVAKFSAQAQAAYAFVSALFTALYDHMPVYTAEPSEAERAAAATLLEVGTGARGEAARADLDGFDPVPPAPGHADEVPAPRSAGWGERVPA